MKRFLCIAMIFILLASVFVGCNKTPEQPNGEENGNPSNEQPPTTPPEEQPSEQPPVHTGAPKPNVSDIAKLDELLIVLEKLGNEDEKIRFFVENKNLQEKMLSSGLYEAESFTPNRFCYTLVCDFEKAADESWFDENEYNKIDMRWPVWTSMTESCAQFYAARFPNAQMSSMTENPMVSFTYTSMKEFCEDCQELLFLSELSFVKKAFVRYCYGLPQMPQEKGEPGVEDIEYLHELFDGLRMLAEGEEKLCFFVGNEEGHFQQLDRGKYTLEDFNPNGMRIDIFFDFSKATEEEWYSEEFYEMGAGDWFHWNFFGNACSEAYEGKYAYAKVGIMLTDPMIELGYYNPTTFLGDLEGVLSMLELPFVKEIYMEYCFGLLPIYLF